MQKGTLKIRDVKKGKEYRLVFENAKGKTLDIVIQPPNRLFDLNAVVDGDPVEFELQNGIPVKCAVPGKEARPVVKERAPVPRETGATTVSAPRNTARARCDAVAPYNFVPFDSAAVIPAPAGESRHWSGSIVCKLEALTPLLVSGKQARASQDSPSECRFMQADGKKIIPGTSIKGMLRSLLEILTFSNMLPVCDRHLFWQMANRPAYRGMFAKDRETCQIVPAKH